MQKVLGPLDFILTDARDLKHVNVIEMKDLTKYLPTLRLLIASTITFIIFQTPTTGGMAEEETDDVLYLLALNHVLAGIEDDVLGA